ncbi:MAG: hypothetical protein NTV14_08345, partial [Coprothermobacterota bacterium]|nr:hypothetical protein [Coprothermobacterota bacterium]
MEMDEETNDIVGLISQAYGRDISVYDSSFLAKSLQKRLAATGITSFAAYRDCLRENRTEAEDFLDSLNITYSEFFRNPLTFALLEQRVLPALVERKALTCEEIRIWSATCAAGEEPYSIAILLDQIASATGKTIPARIFATDIGEEGLATARVGSYSAAALRNVALKHLQDCFTSRGD